jgi:hypothetical protein
MRAPAQRDENDGETGLSGLVAVAIALALYAAWSLATWLLEGRLGTLLRPAAIADRLIYTLLVNVVIGIVGGVLALRFLVRRNASCLLRAGVGEGTPSPLWLMIALGTGTGFFTFMCGGSSSAIVLLNVSAQVLVVSMAEVIVCWALVASTVETRLEAHGRLIAGTGAALAASTLFGLYHLAHSPPFNQPAMIALLTVVGVATALFFRVSRDLYATMLLHNAFGTFGILGSVAASGQLELYSHLRPELLVTAAAAIAAAVVADCLLLRGYGLETRVLAKSRDARAVKTKGRSRGAPLE